MLIDYIGGGVFVVLIMLMVMMMVVVVVVAVIFSTTLVNVRMSVASELNCGLTRQFNLALEIEIEFKLNLRS